MSLVNRAAIFAKEAHNNIGQIRKYTGQPYWVHPAQVAGYVQTVAKGTPEMIAAAWLHDVVEDTPVTQEQIDLEFGSVVGLYVDGMTKKNTDGNRAARKKLELYRLKTYPPEVHTIKLADLISNSHSIIKYDPDFAVTFLSEMRELTNALDRGNVKLLKWADEILKKEGY